MFIKLNCLSGCATTFRLATINTSTIESYLALDPELNKNEKDKKAIEMGCKTIIYYHGSYDVSYAGETPDEINMMLAKSGLIII